MSGGFYSDNWYRVATLKPRLRAHVELHRHLYRGERWYVLQDHATGRLHRFSAAANLLIGQMDGDRTMQEIWERACAEMGDAPPSQEEAIRVLSQLYAADLLNADLSPDLAELAARSGRRRRGALARRTMSPLALRIPLVDPDRFLTATMPFVRPLVSRAGFALWMVAVIWAVIQAMRHWSQLTANLSDRVLAMDNLALMAGAYVAVKALHELGHGYAAKRWGGEVREMGLMVLVFFPVPYVDASSSLSFQSRWRRAGVAAAGIIVETALAAAALAVWIHVEPGIVRAIAFNVMLVSGVSTVLFNGNPLLRFDGYYLLCDLLESPNLGPRANRFVLYLLQRYGFGLRHLSPPHVAPQERGWLVFFAVASFCYRIYIGLVISVFVAGAFFIVGVLLAIWAISVMMILPLGKGLLWLLSSPVLGQRRPRALAVTGGAVALVAAMMLAAPIPHGTVLTGVVWVADNAALRSGGDGEVMRMIAPVGSHVAAGDPVMVLDNPDLQADLDRAERVLAILRLRLDALPLSAQVDRAILAAEIRSSTARRDQIRELVEDLTVRSATSGRVVLLSAVDIEGRFLRKGELVGYIASPDSVVVRTVVSQEDVDPVRNALVGISVRLAGSFWQSTEASLREVVPGATDELAVAALTTRGGGDIATDPREAARALRTVFQIDLATAAMPDPMIGERAFIRFDHGNAPLAFRLHRRIRQLFLDEFNV